MVPVAAHRSPWWRQPRTSRAARPGGHASDGHHGANGREASPASGAGREGKPHPFLLDNLLISLTDGGVSVMHADSTVIVDGATLSGEIVAAVAERGARVAVAPDGTARAAAAHRALLAAVSRERVYGWTTGVGANNRVPVERGNGHGLRLLRSHAGGAGEPVAAAVARGALVIRLNQLAAGGSGADPAWLEALASVLNLGLAPEFPVLGAIGTGDLTGLAATALALIGERPWRGPDGPVTRTLLPRAVADAEALAFLSSNAVTLAQATLAHQALARLLDVELAVAALSHLAVSGSAQPYAEPVQAARPHPGQRATAERLRELLGPDAARPGARVQDPYGLRALHNGNFHGAYLGLALDGARLAVCADAALSPARLAALAEPDRTGLRPF